MKASPDSLFRQLAGQENQDPQPVHSWQPEEVKDIGMRITRDGTWWHAGSPIRRERMVRLFSRVLRRDGAGYFLVTPVEKVRVDVEVTPLLAVRIEIRETPEKEIVFQTNVGDIVIADQDHPIRMLGTADAPLPVVVVRDGIEALITRNIYYEMVESCELIEKAGSQFAMVYSKGCSFELGCI